MWLPLTRSGCGQERFLLVTIKVTLGLASPVMALRHCSERKLRSPCSRYPVGSTCLRATGWSGRPVMAVTCVALGSDPCTQESCRARKWQRMGTGGA